MTDWQWKVIMALVRYVLRTNNVDMPTIYRDSRDIDDLYILTEAAIRDE